MAEDATCNAVAIGGGTGLPVVLRCLVSQGMATTAVVTMADDGGSTGTLRRELGMLPPGDIRNCLVALSEEDSALAQLFQYRFSAGEGLAGHALGNLILAALADITGSFSDAIAVASDLLGTQGRVLPSTLDDVLLMAEDSSGDPVIGQANIAVSAGPIARVHTDPTSPQPYPPVLEAIAEADVIVIGPGSLFTSLVPNFLVAGVANAVRESAARVIYVCNVANQRGETSGMDAADHVEALVGHGLDGAIDTVLLHDTDAYPVDALGEGVCDDTSHQVERVEGGSDAVRRIRDRGIDVVGADLIDEEVPTHHHAERLCQAFNEVC
jgi:uncharacterized cofD-like protein